MGEARRRKLAAKTGTRAEVAAAFADHVLDGTGDAPQIALGPLVWGTEPGRDGRHWYFVVCSIDAKGELRLDQFKVASDDRDLAEECRTGLWMEFIQRRPPIVMHDFDDELPMARWCEALCPGDRSRRIREDIQRERGENPDVWPPHDKPSSTSA